MGRIAENLASIKQKLGSGVELIVVSKFRSTAEITEVYNCGQRIFAENRVQALLERYEVLPKDIQWHLIGHLQTKKVKFITPFISMIHSVDSLKLLQEIEKQAAKVNRIVPCLLQLFVAKEETKFGLSEDELYELLESGEWKAYKHIQVCGLMAMASNTDDQNLIESEFKRVKNIFDAVKDKYFQSDPKFKELSIGMSSDYPIAIKHGSTMVRIGSAVFS